MGNQILDLDHQLLIGIHTEINRPFLQGHQNLVVLILVGDLGLFLSFPNRNLLLYSHRLKIKGDQKTLL